MRSLRRTARCRAGPARPDSLPPRARLHGEPAQEVENASTAARARLEHEGRLRGAVAGGDLGAGFQARIAQIRDETASWGRLGAQMADLTTQGLSQGVSRALEDVARGTKSAKDAFRDWARDFASQVAGMIQQALILKAILALFGGAAGGGGGGGGAASAPAAPAAAHGGTFRVAGYGGLDSRLVALRVSPGELVKVTNGANSPGADGGLHVSLVTRPVVVAEEMASRMSRDPLLTMARFSPSRYRRRRNPEVEKREVALAGLIRSALLKRFESSVHAFAKTAERMVRAHDLFLEALDRGFVATGEALADMAEAMDTGSEDALDDLLRDAGSEPATDFDVARLQAAVESDRDLLAAFGKRAASVKEEDDPKLLALTESLLELLQQAERDGRDPEEVRDCRKVLVFSYFAETVDWIVRHLERVFVSDRRFAAYRGRLASVSGQESRGGVSRRDAVFGFAPQSSEAPPGSDDDRFDILIATDVLAEGLNLQQARNMVNFDLPWNPMRLVQRHGRIDRIGSPHERVYIRCFFPDARLDELLALEDRIRRKLAQAAASIGVESEVIPGGKTAEVVFSETREEIERLRREERDLFVNGGESEREHSGEEYRQELRKGIERLGEDAIRTLPWGAGSGFVGGAEKGHVFCARVGDRSFLRFVPASRAKPIRDTLSCLRLVACREDTTRHLTREMQEAAYAAWETARRDIFEEWSYSTDPANLQPRVRPLFRRAADHLRKHAPEGVDQPDLGRVISALEAPWGIRIEKQVRPVLDAPGEDPRAISAALVAKVHALGLQPFEPPRPLPVIDESDVVLICWLAVVPSWVAAEARQ